MSVPRPAICVDTVTAPSLPASAITAASSASFLALSTTAGTPRRCSRSCSSSDSATSWVPTSTGCPVVMHLDDVRDDRVDFRRGGDVDPVGLVLADIGGVRWDRGNTELVELAQLLARGQRGSGHAAHRRIPVDQRLHGDGVEHLAGFGGLDAFFGLDRRLQTVRPALQLGDAAAGGVDQVHGVVAHDVVHVAVQQDVRVQCDVDLGEGGADMLLGVEIDSAELFFEFVRTGLGQMDVAAIGVGVVIRRRPATHRRVG